MYNEMCLVEKIINSLHVRINFLLSRQIVGVIHHSLSIELLNATGLARSRLTWTPTPFGLGHHTRCC